MSRNMWMELGAGSTCRYSGKLATHRTTPLANMQQCVQIKVNQLFWRMDIGLYLPFSGLRIVIIRQPRM